MFKTRRTYVLFFFFVKQKTAYEMRISDWSSDVCSSDLGSRPGWRQPPAARGRPCRPAEDAAFQYGKDGADRDARRAWGGRRYCDRRAQEIGRASCRGRVSQYV